MAQRRFHYDLAFEHYLRAKTIAYIAVDEARKALHGSIKLKNFDFVVYGSKGQNLLVDVKGRKHSGKNRKSLDNWVTEDDVYDLLRWQDVFGKDFKATLVFLYWCESQPPDALFLETFCYRDRWYSVLAVDVDQYKLHMKPRSPKWKTVHLPAKAYRQISVPLLEMI